MIYKATEDETLLDKLVKDDARWRMVALKLCGNKEMADDLVQDMYLKVAEYKSINASFVYKTIKSLFLLSFRNKKLESLENYDNISNRDSTFEPDDYQQSVLDKFNELYWIDQELIIESYDRSLREIQKEYPMIHYSYAHRTINKSTREVLGDDFDEKHNNKRNKRK